VRALVDERWGTWKRGSYKAAIPAEPPLDGPKTAHVDWPTDTLPLIAVTYRGPAWTDANEETVALDAISRLGFDQNSPLYQKLVIEEQKVDTINAGGPTNLDPELFGVIARVKNPADLATIQQELIDTSERFATTKVDPAKLEALKKHLRYEFALQLNNSESIASTVAQYVALRRTPEAINRYYEAYEKLTPADIQNAAKKYLNAKNRTIVTLSSTAKSGAGK